MIEISVERARQMRKEIEAVGSTCRPRTRAGVIREMCRSLKEAVKTMEDEKCRGCKKINTCAMLNDYSALVRAAMQELTEDWMNRIW